MIDSQSCQSLSVFRTAVQTIRAQKNLDSGENGGRTSEGGTRTRELAGNGSCVQRSWMHDLMNDSDGVLNKILNERKLAETAGWPG